ncbi:hypothetical protein PGTUg99_004244 [Puccinia graminis f. sp. tritici]|uniref:Uncharacterized protein n=1 Tax=Puccinia graminis f. sp. tritici TaxID=56615 RepID=A0A5B0LKX6_PUCGR|nr:hypothetical protein PGTUg99_004244 [Puccinia graminis f. sp. tritici]
MVTTTKSHGPAYSAWEVARKKTLLIHHRAIPTFAQPNTERASYRHPEGCVNRLSDHPPSVAQHPPTP